MDVNNGRRSFTTSDDDSPGLNSLSVHVSEQTVNVVLDLLCVRHEVGSPW